MNESKITDSIMQRVVSFEKKRSAFWLGRFIVVILAILGGAVFFLWATVEELIETRSFDVLVLLTQDRDILREFWLDTLTFFWDEMPKLEMTVGISLSVLFVALFLLSRKQIGLFRKRFSSASKYHLRR